MDGIKELVEFASKLEKAVRLTIEDDRIMTVDVAKVSELPVNRIATTEEFITAVKRKLKKLLH
jgi:isocitrate dehydrogenase